MENELPEGWIECNLGDIIKVSSGDGLTSSNMNKEGEIPVYGGNGITGFHDKSNIKEETIVIGRVGFYCGSVHLTPETAWVTDNALRVSFSHSNIDKRFLFWLLKSLNLGQYSGSSAQPVVSGTKLYQVQICFPPLAEQTRIVARLDAVFGHLETLKTSLSRIPELLKKFRQTVLTQAVTGKLTETWREENPDVESIENKIRSRKNLLFSERTQPTIPNWAVVNLEDVLLEKGIFDGPFGSNLKTDDYTISGVRVIRLENINTLFFDNSKQTFISEEKYQSLAKHTVFEGDIIFSSFISDDIRACILPALETSAIAKADCFCLRADEKAVLTKLLVYMLCSEQVKNSLTDQAHGITRPRINTTQLRKLILQIPPLEEQHEIVTRVEALFAKADALEAQYGSLKAKLDALPQALLAKAFRGALVPQNPADEPASVLLARLKSAPAPGGKTKTGQTKLAFMGE